MVKYFFLMLSVSFGSTCFAASEGDQIGIECGAFPCTKDNRGINVCSCIDYEKYPGWTLLAAEKLTIKKCKKSNALDYGEQYGKSCYNQCKKSTSCFPYAG